MVIRVVNFDVNSYGSCVIVDEIDSLLVCFVIERFKGEIIMFLIRLCFDLLIVYFEVFNFLY